MRSRDLSSGQTARHDHCVARRKFQFAVEQVAAHQPALSGRARDSGFASLREAGCGGAVTARTTKR